MKWTGDPRGPATLEEIAERFAMVARGDLSPDEVDAEETSRTLATLAKSWRRDNGTELDD